MNKAKIQQFISQNRLDEAIKELLVITKNTHLYNDVLLNSTRFQQYRNLQIKGTESSDDLNRLRMQISHSLLALTENLEVEKMPPTFLKSSWFKTGVIVLMVALIGWAIPNLFTKENKVLSNFKDKNTEQKDTLNIPQPVKKTIKESENIQSTKPKMASETQNTTNYSSKPMPILPSIKYVDEGQSVKVAFIKSDAFSLPDFQRSVEGLFKEKGISISNNYLQKAFYTKFGNNINDIDMTDLRTIGISEKLNCICQIEKNISVTEVESFGTLIKTANASIKIYILNLKTGNLDTPISIQMNGAGVTESAAMRSLEERLIASERLKMINISQCQ